MGDLYYDVGIVGAGTLGLAHAYAAARRGLRVVVFEKSPAACGASVRNFGMIWPIGQPAGRMHALAVRSRELWLQVLGAAQLPFRDTGSLHLAYHADEEAVAREFAAGGPALGFACEWRSGPEVLACSAAVRPEGLRGALWSATELTVDPRLILNRLPGFLTDQYGVEFHFSTAVQAVEPPVVKAGSTEWRAETVIVCGGDDFETLFPVHFAASGITRCKLQMLRTAPQPAGWQLGPSLAGGLTMRFYPSFGMCPSLPALRRRIAAEMPEYDRWQIHVMASQTADGAVTLGDSHEYGLAVDIFNRTEIDDLILKYARGFLQLPEPAIAQRWYGVYAKHPEQPLVRIAPAPRVQVVTAAGGSGMTLSFGIAEETIEAVGA